MKSDRLELSADGTSMRKLSAIAAAAFMTALGAGTAALCLEWWGGSASHRDVEKKVEPVENKNDALEKRVKTLEDDASEARLTARGVRETLVFEIGQRVAVEAALRAALDPRKRDAAARQEAAERASARAGQKYDDLIYQQHEQPHDAATKALKAEVLQR